jgi:hypothetical protein
MFIKRSLKISIIVLVAFALATVSYAFAASNTVPDGKAGDGSGTITGYNVTNVVYTQDSGNPVNITAVAFDLDAAAGTVRVRLITGGALQSCTNTAGTHWSCTITGVTVNAANTLEVVASE